MQNSIKELKLKIIAFDLIMHVLCLFLQPTIIIVNVTVITTAGSGKYGNHHSNYLSCSLVGAS